MKITVAEAKEMFDTDDHVYCRCSDAAPEEGWAEYTIVIEHDGKFYQFLHYDGPGWNDVETDLIDCVEVEKYEAMETYYREMKTKEA